MVLDDYVSKEIGRLMKEKGFRWKKDSFIKMMIECDAPDDGYYSGTWPFEDTVLEVCEIIRAGKVEKIKLWDWKQLELDEI